MKNRADKEKNPPCVARIPGIACTSACRSPGKVQENGKWYCGVHDPVKKRAKRAAKRVVWDAESAWRDADWDEADAKLKIANIVLSLRSKVTFDFEVEKALVAYDKAVNIAAKAKAKFEEVKRTGGRNA